MKYYFGIALSCVSASIFLLSLFRKSKQEMLRWQSFEVAINIVKNVLLGGYSGAAVQTLTWLQNYLGSRDLFSTNVMVFILVTRIGLGASFNNLGALGWLPIVASTMYTIAVRYVQSQNKMRLALIVNLSLWVAYGVILRDYPSIAVNTLGAVISAVSIIKSKRHLN